MIGFFTKHGDADFSISGRYKTQVRALARHLAVPERMANKPSDPQLYPGQKLMDELPLTYQNLDPLLVGLFDRHLTPAPVRRQTTPPLTIVEDVLRRFHGLEYKRVQPSKPPLL